MGPDRTFYLHRELNSKLAILVPARQLYQTRSGTGTSPPGFLNAGMEIEKLKVRLGIFALIQASYRSCGTMYFQSQTALAYKAEYRDVRFKNLHFSTQRGA